MSRSSFPHPASPSVDCKQSLRMVTRARKSSEESEKKREAKGKLGRRRESFFPPLSSFPLSHFALSSSAELRLDWLKRDCSQSSTSANWYVLELTVGFESNLNNNAVHKKEKYLNLINEMSRNYRCVRFVNLSMSSLGVFSDECSTFLDMMNDIGIDKKQQRYIIKKMINIAIRATYYIFCCRNRNWDSPGLMQFLYIFFSE